VNRHRAPNHELCEFIDRHASNREHEARRDDSFGIPFECTRAVHQC
jgi:hypothetical protein